MGKPREPGRPRSMLWVWGLAAVFTYVASIGPVAGIYGRTEPHHPLVDRVVRASYAPLTYAAEKSVLIRQPLLWWVEVWVRMLAKPKHPLLAMG